MKFICMPCTQSVLEAAAGDLSPACQENPVPDVVLSHIWWHKHIKHLEHAMALYRLAHTKQTIFPILWLCWHYMSCSSYVLIWDDTWMITPPYCLFFSPSSLKVYHFPNTSWLERSHVYFKEILRWGLWECACVPRSGFWIISQMA